jgi:hypothetical protein
MVPSFANSDPSEIRDPRSEVERVSMYPFLAKSKRSEIRDPIFVVERVFMVPHFTKLKRAEIRNPKSEIKRAFMYPLSTKSPTDAERRSPNAECPSSQKYNQPEANLCELIAAPDCLPDS